MKPAADAKLNKGKPMPSRYVQPTTAVGGANQSRGISTFSAPAPLPKGTASVRTTPATTTATKSTGGAPSSFPIPKRAPQRSGSAMPRPASSLSSRSSSVFSQRSSSIAFPKPSTRPTPTTATQPFNARCSLGGESLASLINMTAMSAGTVDRGRQRAGGMPLSEDDLLEAQLLQWRFLNHRFERAKAEQLQAGLDQLHALLISAMGTQEQVLAAEVERHQHATQQAVTDAMADVHLGLDLPALERFDRLHDTFLNAVINSCNTLQTTGIYVSSEAELQRELQRCTRSLHTMAERLRPACGASRELQASWQKLHTMQELVADNLRTIAARLRDTEQQAAQQHSVLIGAIQQADLTSECSTDFSDLPL
eukprot:GGOE01036962.1.p1 GENE.GGOE01036962.1~~GGOE01036962.1.p1  ORF type:complete len:367 (+),score=113.96 GGOE01036962.1:96-1196(+)